MKTTPMVIPSDFPPSDFPEDHQVKKGHAPRVHEIVVPVFLKVQVFADDDLQAEFKAIQAVRELGTYHGNDFTVCLKGVIAPVHSKNQPSCPS